LVGKAVNVVTLTACSHFVL